MPLHFLKAGPLPPCSDPCPAAPAPPQVVWEDKDAFKQGPYVVAYEPHSVLPQGICIFSQYATDAVPPALANARILASSAAFWAPVMRHL